MEFVVSFISVLVTKELDNCKRFTSFKKSVRDVIQLLY